MFIFISSGTTGHTSGKSFVLNEYQAIDWTNDDPDRHALHSELWLI